MFYKQVLALCMERGISPTKLALDIGLSTSTPNGWKKGSVPQPSTLKKIADYFGVNIEYLTEGKPQNTAANVSHSAVVQGNHATTLIVKNGGIIERELSDQAAELLKIYETLDVRRQTLLLSRAFELDEEVKKAKK